MVHGQLNAGDQSDFGRFGRGARLFDTRQGVVVGEGDGAETGIARSADQHSRAVGAV